MAQPYRTEEYISETANGSPVKIKRNFFGRENAWSTGYYEDIFFIDVLVDKDLELIASLGLPHWYFDFTGKGMVLRKSGYVAMTQLGSLNVKTPWIKRG